MVIQTRRQAAAANEGASSAVAAPAAPAPAPSRPSQAPRNLRSSSRSTPSTSSKPAGSKGSTPASSAPGAHDPSKLDTNEPAVEPATQLEPELPTIPLYDFDLPLELDRPFGIRVSAFNPASYAELKRKLNEWFPLMCRPDPPPAEVKPAQNQDNAVKAEPAPPACDCQLAEAQPSAEVQRRDADSPTKGRANRQRSKGKTKKPDNVHLEVEFVPEMMTASDMDLPRRDWNGPSWMPEEQFQAYAVFALAPPNYRSPATAAANANAKVAEASEDSGPESVPIEDADEDDSLLLGYIVPSAMREPAHPLLHLDPILVAKGWVQLYGEVTLVPPFLPPISEVVEADDFGRPFPRTACIGQCVVHPNSAPMIKEETPTTQPCACATEIGLYANSTRLLGVLSIQVGLEPAALQYGAGNAAVDGFVGSNDDLKDTGAEGSLSLARALRVAIPTVVDWQHSFIAIDAQANTYWDRNESFYSLPPKQSTLVRHAVLDKVEAVDLPAASKSPSKKRKRSSRPNSALMGRSRSTRSYDDDEEEEYDSAKKARQDSSLKFKLANVPLGKEVSRSDAELGDPTSETHLPLDTNIASLLEACRPPSDGPQVFPPSDMILTPLLGYQARCLAWMIKKETVVDEDVGQLMPNWVPLCCKPPSQIAQRRLQLEAEREALLDAMQRGLSLSRRNVNVKAAAATVSNPSAVAAGNSGDSHTMSINTPLKREPFIDPVEIALYFDQVSGMLSLRRFTCRPSEPGGALCESMGLGKTLESLALIASHPRPGNADLLSYDTSRSARMIAEMDPAERPFVSRATLVVCPAALVEQWMDEIRKHYRSRSKSSARHHGADPYLQPGVVRYRHSDFAWDAESSRDAVRALAKKRLTQVDIVVATYEELAHQLSESHRVQRTGNPVRTPLLEVLFWRILLDEAQIVAGASGKATEMIHELWRSNCWMVTGTPVTKGIRDIQGIFAFLDHDPLAAPRFFRELLQEPFSRGCIEGIRRLRAILPRFVWRHTQAHVEAEMTLPPCRSEVLEIDLKHVERLFYDKEVSRYREIYAKRAVQGTATVAQPTFLVDLRQLLSHPQIADELMFSNNFSRHSFAELFRQFCQRAESELDSMRMQAVVSTLQLVWGHDYYHAEQDKRHWRGGQPIFQQPEDVLNALKAALRIATLALQDQALARAEADKRTEAGQSDATPQIQDTTKSLHASGPVSAATDKSEAASAQPNSRTDNLAYGGADAAARVQLAWEEANYWLRLLLRSKLRESTTERTDEASSEEIGPPARWDPERPTRTFFDKEFKNANDKSVNLADPRFHLVVQDASVDDMDADELMAQIEAERGTTGGSSSPRKKQRKDADIAPGLLKKSRLRGNASQRKQARVWLYKPKERLETTHAKLMLVQADLQGKEHEVAFLRQKLLEVRSTEAQFQTNESAKPPGSSTEAAGNSLPGASAECQICYEAKANIGVLPCYHSFCTDCIDAICEKSPPRPATYWRGQQGPRCPSCRLPFHPDRVTRVMERGRSASSERDSEVAGDWSGKITGLILDLKTRLRADATQKAVIFSHWPKMLAFVRDALVQNDIAAVVFGGNEANQAEALRAIRDDENVHVILVPFRASAGAAGLTLTSCNLAYLMEPALDAALEAQAVGRIDRIGQRRDTTVIRVKMRDTIEDAVMRIADERSRRGMALATHVDTAPADATANAEAPQPSTSAIGAQATTGQGSNADAAGSDGPARGGVRAQPSGSGLRERSIKASVAASVGSARESDQTSLTMTEVGLILGFDIAEEKRKARQRREDLLRRTYGPRPPFWAEELTNEELEAVDEDLQMYGPFSEDEEGEFDDDVDMELWRYGYDREEEDVDSVLALVPMTAASSAADMNAVMGPEPLDAARPAADVDVVMMGPGPVDATRLAASMRAQVDAILGPRTAEQAAREAAFDAANGPGAYDATRLAIRTMEDVHTYLGPARMGVEPPVIAASDAATGAGPSDESRAAADANADTESQVRRR